MNSYSNLGLNAARLVAKNLIWVVIIAGVAVTLTPFLWMVSTSLKELHETFRYPPVLIPKDPVWGNYVKAWQTAKFGRLFINTSIYTGFCLAGQLISCSLGAYAFARLQFVGRRVLFIFYLGTMMIPYPVTLIPLFGIVHTFGWVNSFYGLIIPNMFGSAFGVFLLRQFFMTIPKELEDAATIDGCGKFRIYLHIILPLSKPVVATLSIFMFMVYWNDFLWPLIITTSESLRVITLGLALFQARFMTDWHLVMAGATISIVPILVVFLLLQRYFIQGITLGAIKG